MLHAFAKKHALPTQVIEVGPPERRVKRLVVGLNFHNWDVMQDYIKTFHLEGAAHPDLSGVLPLEYAIELDRTGTEYVGSAVRPRPDQNAPIWMFGREDVSRQQWWDVSVMHDLVRQKSPPIVGFAHLLGLTGEEQKNIWHFLYNPAERAPCKSSNCVAWQSQIEFGKTAQGVSDDERRF